MDMTPPPSGTDKPSGPDPRRMGAGRSNEGAHSNRKANRHLIPLDLESSWPESPEMAAFLADVKSLDKRLEMRDPWVCPEIKVLLQGAIDAAKAEKVPEKSDAMAIARSTLARAEAVYYRDVQTKNRIFYVSGLLIGVAFIVLGPIFLLWLAGTIGQYVATNVPRFSAVGSAIVGATDFIPLSVAAPLFFFAGLGASASVLLRLTTIDLREETSKAMVFIAAATRPALAVIFASVIYVILDGGLINVGNTDGQRTLIWVAAFLCGYSERFASDILEKLPFPGLGNDKGKSKDDADVTGARGG